jgi:hypothetical protein
MRTSLIDACNPLTNRSGIVLEYGTHSSGIHATDSGFVAMSLIMMSYGAGTPRPGPGDVCPSDEMVYAFPGSIIFEQQVKESGVVLASRTYMFRQMLLDEVLVISIDTGWAVGVGSLIRFATAPVAWNESGGIA